MNAQNVSLYDGLGVSAKKSEVKAARRLQVFERLIYVQPGSMTDFISFL